MVLSSFTYQTKVNDGEDYESSSIRKFVIMRKEVIKLSDIKKSVIAVTDSNKHRNDRNVLPNFHYILKTMKAIDDFEDKYKFIKGFYFANKDDLPESDRTKVKVMMDLAKMQLEQHKGVKSDERTN